jgi:hypothetical protein
LLAANLKNFRVQGRFMRKNLSPFLILIFVSVFSLRVSAQTDNIQTKTADEKPTEVSITANVTARELKFETVPNPTVEFPGNPVQETVWDAKRENLPRPVEPGVTYRNIGIRLRISSRFADIERIVAEALGEVASIENETQMPPVSSQSETKPVSQQIVSKRKTPPKKNNRRR